MAPPDQKTASKPDENTIIRPAVPPDCLAAFPKPAAFDVPARDLTRKEARDIVVYLIAQGELDFNRKQAILAFDKKCGLVSPHAADHLQVKPGSIAGVKFVNHVTAGAQTVDVIDNCDVRIIVMLYRLALKMKSLGVSEIHHLGIGHGNEDHPDDCHNTGRALDFSGCVIVGADGVADTLNIQKDWGSQPISLPDGSQHKTWPENTSTFYRLEALKPPAASHLGNAARIFKAVYDFAVQQCADTSVTPDVNRDPAKAGSPQPPPSPTTIGQQSKQIIHPDHHDLALRNHHQDHIHMQIGPTGLETNPP